MSEHCVVQAVGTKGVLLCGHRAFAARGLAQLLSANGCRVTEFSRGPIGRVEQTVFGPVDRLDSNPHLESGYHTAINFIVCKHDSLQKNLAYIQSLLRLCEAKGIGHLIHISSMSVYPDSTRLFTEKAAVKPFTAQAFCSYAGIKTATEAYLREHLPPEVKLSLLRPAFVLGSGLTDPLGSVGRRIAGNRLLVLGRGERQRPVISRSVLHRALLQLVQAPPQDRQEVLLMVDRESPTCLAYLQACCESLGLARRAVSLPMLLWLPRFLAYDVGRRGRHFSPTGFLRAAIARATPQHYDPSWTEQRLGWPLVSDWRADLMACRNQAPGTRLADSRGAS